MIKKLTAVFLLPFLVAFLFASPISFSGGKSSLVLKNGEEKVSLEEGAKVIADSLTITSDSMVLSGNGWETVECFGSVCIIDNEKNIEIRTSKLLYDRASETIIIPAWVEIDDKEQELYMEAGSLYYYMEEERLELSMLVTLFKISDNSLMKCTSESLIYDREKENATLKGRSHVEWNGDNYEADIIVVDMTNNEITLSGGIKGTING